MDRKFHEEAKTKYNDESKMLLRESWLADMGRSENDVMMEENGTEYVMNEDESEFGEEYVITHTKVILPRELQTYHVNF